MVHALSTVALLTVAQLRAVCQQERDLRPLALDSAVRISVPSAWRVELNESHSSVAEAARRGRVRSEPARVLKARMLLVAALRNLPESILQPGPGFCAIAGSGAGA